MRRLALTALLLPALLAPPAAASDRSVYEAWISRDTAFGRLADDFRRAARVYRRSDGQRIRPTLRAARKAIRLVNDVLPRIAAEEPSSDPGRRAKQLATRSQRMFRRSLVLLQRGVRAVKAGNDDRGVRLLRGSRRNARQSERVAKKARSLFRRAGVI
jgi:hypothetical protein